MDEKLKLGDASSSGSSTDDSSTDSDSDSEEDGSSDEADRRKKKSKKNRKTRKGTSKKKKRSGKNRKITSRVLYPQDWPHSFLSLQYVDKEKKYDQLTMAEFCAGYCAILEGIKDKDLALHQLSHLKDLMYLTTNYKWKAVLNFHAAVLLEIERGNLKWGASFHRLESTTLAGGFLRGSGGGNAVSLGAARSIASGGNNSRQQSVQTASDSSNSNGPILFCKEYQRGVCTSTTDHDAIDRYGEVKFFRHICATCWLKARRRLPHPETHDSCPSREL